ncbi:hypothetical protein AJ78_07240 [Emergomyces pasteurianus Ep9510]|uniref:Uncharacterized protein n=1 Tax=Emergomyces pasteurianus Ep9510 TaxID=1447872 RepID=A0A1J9Q7D2_9EURO|nr:hypothetical protein AJ78_07240 [Emergomyces pasteurianus Ep9510]
MAHIVSCEPQLPVAAHSDEDINTNLVKINEKVKQLNVDGLTRADQAVLKNRLSFIFLGPNECPRSNEVTTWRQSRARRTYRAIQDADNHLFLAIILTIPPTECAKTRFDKTVDYLVNLEDYSLFRFSLRTTTKRLFDSTSAEQGFAGNPNYQGFIQALFPQKIQFAYSLIRPNDLSSFLETVLEGIYTSQQWKIEREQGGKTSGCITIFVPTGEEDGSCNIVVDQTVLMEAIHKFQLSDLKLE